MPTTEQRFDSPHVAFYFGGLVTIAAFSWLMGQSWAQHGEGAGLAIAIAFAAVLAAGSAAFHRRGWQIPSGLMATVAVTLVPLIVFAAQRVAGWEPDGFGEYDAFYDWISSGWVLMEVATALAAVVALRLTGFAFLMTPLCFIAWFFSMDAAPLLFGTDVSARQHALVSATVGTALVLVGLLLDRRGRHLRSHAFWAHLFGLITLSGTACALAFDLGEWGWTMIGLSGLAAIGASVLLGRRTYAVFGGLHVFSWTCHLAFDVFGPNLLFPIIMGGIGVGIIGLGIRLAGRSGSTERDGRGGVEALQ